MDAWLAEGRVHRACVLRGGLRGCATQHRGVGGSRESHCVDFIHTVRGTAGRKENTTRTWTFREASAFVVPNASVPKRPLTQVQAPRGVAGLEPHWLDIFSPVLLTLTAGLPLAIGAP